MTDWPEGISNGLTVPCMWCGRVPVVDYTVDDRTWRRIVPPRLRREVVCIDCFVDQDESVVASIGRVQVATASVTAVFNDPDVYRWHESEDAP